MQNNEIFDVFILKGFKKMLKKKFSIVLQVSILIILTACSTSKTLNEQKTKATFKKSDFGHLNGWSENNASGLKKSLTKSCPNYMLKTGNIVENQALFGTYDQWHSICVNLENLTTSPKVFFEKHFDVYQISPNEKGLFTGYYIPYIKGSSIKTDFFDIPVLATPKNLVNVNLNDFNTDVSNKSKSSILQGKVENSWVIPYDSRAEINNKIKQGQYQGLELVWLEDKVERFFLQLQGSGIVELEDGSTLHLSYGGRNGHEYTGIGQYLLHHEDITDTTMQGIKNWLRDNPKKQNSILNKNKLFIFFKENKDKIVVGAQETQLIPMHSVAIDSDYIPLGTPVFINTHSSVNKQKLQIAATAQDVGSAIIGPVRADIFFGEGKEAGRIAGGQYSSGTMHIFVPKT